MTEQAVAAAEAATEKAGETDASTAKRDAAYWEAEAKKAIAARDEAKRRVRELGEADAELKKIRDAQMSEVEKAAARIKELEPKAARTERMETVVGELLERSLASVPEELRDVVPATLSPEDKLAWIEAARAKGLFDRPDAAPPPKPTDSPISQRPAASGKVIKRSAFEKLSPGAQAEHVRAGGAVVD